MKKLIGLTVLMVLVSAMTIYAAGEGSGSQTSVPATANTNQTFTATINFTNGSTAYTSSGRIYIYRPLTGGCPDLVTYTATGKTTITTSWTNGSGTVAGTDGKSITITVSTLNALNGKITWTLKSISFYTNGTYTYTIKTAPTGGTAASLILGSPNFSITGGTATKTNTPTTGDTRTWTPTVTPTMTQTVTQTVTETVTKTWTKTITETFTPTFTKTITETITETITQTVTQTITQTWTFTMTPTIGQNVVYVQSDEHSYGANVDYGALNYTYGKAVSVVAIAWGAGCAVSGVANDGDIFIEGVVLTDESYVNWYLTDESASFKLYFNPYAIGVFPIRKLLAVGDDFYVYSDVSNTAGNSIGLLYFRWEPTPTP